ncbi:MAG: carboxypeptidase-like regulatory domain-containing protein [Paludibacteraceae bacterium]|nr:carboxypeptidase-like regulatory domain-containing protein [Paludibacteraceae bacterium]
MKLTTHMFIAAVLCLLASCHSKTDTASTITYKGTVTNNEGVRLEGVRISAADTIMTTDSTGTFRYIKHNADKRFVLKLEKEGFFDFICSREANDTTRINIKLSPKAKSENCDQFEFDATKGTTIKLSGIEVAIPENALVDDKGTDYKGHVKADVLYLTPDDINFRNQMPGGDLLALNTNRDTVALISYGMVNVQLKGENSQKLQLKEGKRAKLTYKIPNCVKSNTPDTIPLWHFNEANGLWEEEGYSLHKGDTYEGEVKHFSWWNCDCMMKPFAFLTIQTVDASGKPVSAWVSAKTKYFGILYTPTDSNGIAKGYITSGQTIYFSASASNTYQYWDDMTTIDDIATFDNGKDYNIVLTVGDAPDQALEETDIDSTIIEEKNNCLKKDPKPAKMQIAYTRENNNRNEIFWGGKSRYAGLGETFKVDPSSLWLENKIKLTRKGEQKKYFEKCSKINMPRPDVIECFVDDYRYHKIRLAPDGATISRIDTSKYWDSLSERAYWACKSIWLKPNEHKHVIDLYEIYQDEEFGIAKRDSLIGITTFYTNDLICKLQFTDTTGAKRTEQIYPPLSGKELELITKKPKIDGSKPIKLIAETCEGYQFTIKRVNCKQSSKNFIYDGKNDYLSPVAVRLRTIAIKFDDKLNENLYDTTVKIPLLINKKNIDIEKDKNSSRPAIDTAM